MELLSISATKLASQSWTHAKSIGQNIPDRGVVGLVLERDARLRVEVGDLSKRAGSD